MPKIIKNGREYSGVPIEVVTAWPPTSDMPTTELDIRQLADNGGTDPIAPITVPQAVINEDGTTVADDISELKNGLTQDTGWVTLASGVQYRCFGQNVQFIITGYDITSTSGRTYIGAIPAKYAPTYSQMTPLVAAAGSSAYIFVDTVGGVYLYRSTTGSVNGAMNYLLG